ncbi:MAG: peptidyl-prolyl cis-trans isomerase [Gemmatimonadetes bacterium]|nr:peptidyl-prolyl cis-trans isomerase [Gemmatimonadota bacterium]
MRANAKWIMLLVALAFVGWMVFDVGMDVTGQGGASIGDAAARVNGTKIDLQTYYNALRSAQERRRFEGGGYGYTLEEQRAFEDAVFEELVQQVLLQQEYNRRGIRVSDDEIIAAAQFSPPPEIIQAPDFQTDGVFDFDKYRRFLASNVDPSFMFALEARYREEIPRTKLFEQLITDIYVTDAKLWQMYRDEHDSVTIRLLELVPAALVADSEITLTDDEVRAYIGEHPDEFRRPAAAYTSYIMTSRLTNSADTVTALARAQQLREEILDGTDFADVAERESADSISRNNGGDLGVVPLGQFIAEFEEAVLALPTGEVSEPVQTPFGYHLIKPERVTADSIHASHILIPIELAGDHLDQVDSRADTMDMYAAEQTDPAALDDVADLLGTTVLTAPTVFESGRMFIDLQPVPDAALWAFEAIPGEISQVIETPSAFYLFRLDSVRPEGTPPFEEVEEEVRRAAFAAVKWERARALATEIETKLRAGQALAEVALEHLLNFTTLGPMTRVNPDPRVAFLPEVVGTSFGLGVGQASAPIEAGDGIYFLEPIAKQLSDSSTFASETQILRFQVLQNARQDRLRRFMLSLRSGADVIDRRRVLERAQRELQANATGRFNPLGF